MILRIFVRKKNQNTFGTKSDKIILRTCSFTCNTAHFLVQNPIKFLDTAIQNPAKFR